MGIELYKSKYLFLDYTILHRLYCNACHGVLTISHTSEFDK